MAATTKRPAPKQKGGQRTVRHTASGVAPSAAGRATLQQHDKDYRALVKKYTLKSLDELLNLSDILAEVRALYEYALTFPTKGPVELFRLRMHTISQALENITAIHAMQSKSGSVEEQVQLRLTAMLTPIILGFQRVIQEYVPQQHWKDALAALREAAATPVAETVDAPPLPAPSTKRLQ